MGSNNGNVAATTSRYPASYVTGLEVAAIMVEISCYITRASDDDDAVAAVLTASSARSEGDVLCIVYSPFSAFIPCDYATLLLYYCTMLLLSHGRTEFVHSQLVQQNSQIGQTLCLFCYVHSYHEGFTWENSTPNLAADCCVRSCLLLQMLLHLRTSPSWKLQQVFEEALQKEAEARAGRPIDSGKQVQVRSPPKILINARGTAYEQGDPNMGYNIEDTRPRVVSNHPKESRSSPPDSTGEELSDSEVELLEVLEGVVSSNQEGRVLTPGIKTATSPSKVHSEIKSSLANDPPDRLDIGVSKVAAELVSKGSAGFNKFLSKSAKKRLKKQAKEESLCSFSNGGNLTIPSSLE
ncbi:hypothetical protein RHSIM_Rhsim04G0148300 [Rhododendron simsii]|uniref:Uncharacterized protein n=1 Tax=Rhododendron simsii TaxID=118357 RepID=A0A834H3W7_RHOSS|nr:hypothetical protein RHSIM_Rhsim04G0148300 [Rhododendron simsii]